MKRILILFLFGPLLFLAQSQKKYPALLWKISGNGLKKNSYLYGTMHVSNRVAYYLSEQFFDALKSVDVVGLETNPGEWLENMERTGELEEISQIRSSGYYNGSFYQNTFAAAFPEKRMLKSILSYDPDIINGLLYRQNKARENFEESTYIDLFIYQSASKLNKQVISLEDFVRSEINARLSTIPDENPEQNLSRKYFSGVQAIEDAYREGNLDKLDSLSKLVSSKNTQKYLIDERNVFFVNTMDSVLKTKSLFSGVGAAHLPGENGVIELLRKKGYTVEPLFPKISKKSNAMREKLDMQVKPVTFQKQIIPDSSFSVNVPGKLYQIVDAGYLKYYIHADMANGSFYTIARLRHLGPVFNVSPESMMSKIDSLLFENIPGKIILKKEIVSNTGVKGIEIINKTRRGDEQRYQIYFTDLEMILFKLGGKLSYASGNESKQFFNSIQFISKPETAVDFSPKTKGFSVKLPANYSYTKQKNSSLTGPVEDLFAYSKKQFYGVQHAVYNDFNYLEEDTFELNQFAKNILVNYDFKENRSFKIQAEQGFPCIRFSGSNKNGKQLTAKLYIKGVHYYYVYFISDLNSSFDSDFFNSFRLTDFNYVNPIKEVVDKDFHFKTQDEVTENARSRFNEAYAKAYALMQPEKKDAKNDFDSDKDNKYYYSPSSNECVNILYEKYNDYDFREVKDIEDNLLNTYGAGGGMHLVKRKTQVKDGNYSFECLLKDTATARAIKVKTFIRGGLKLEIAAPFDTTIGMTGWIRQFIDAFSPLDSVVGVNIFENKFATLLNDLSSSDSLRREQANTSVNSISFQEAFTGDFVQFVSGSKINQVNEDSRAQLFVNGGTLKSEKIIAPYRDLYKQYTDSFYLQLCLLKGLAYLKTQSSYTAFYELLMSEPPLVGAVNTVNDVFFVLHDSLELCKQFFPEILLLTKYEEYKDAVYTLMSELVSKKLITPASFESEKNNILLDANLALKRYNPASTSNTYDQGSFDYLDKASKEIAESIKGSLEGLSNNNFYKNSDYLRTMEAFNRPALVNYARVLAPFYKTDEKVKQFFDKLSRIKSQNILMPLTITLLKQNVILSDTLIRHYSGNKYTRAYFYSELDKEKLAHRFDKKFLSQESLIESVLLGQKQLSSYYSYDKDKSRKDSIFLVKKVDAVNKYQKGKMFIYRHSKSKNEQEQWSAVFIKDTKELINPKIEIVQSAYYIDSQKSEEENINKLLDYFYLTYRARAQPNSNSYD